MGNYYGPLESFDSNQDIQYYTPLPYKANNLMHGRTTRSQSSSFQHISPWTTTYAFEHHQPPLLSSSAPSPSLTPPAGKDYCRTRRFRRRRSKSTSLLPSPAKYCIDQILDTDDTPIGEIINRDTDSARNAALDLCSSNDPDREGIVFWTDASYSLITESQSSHDQINQWNQIKQDPEKWRAGVAIAWNVTPSSRLYHHTAHGNTGRWREERYPHSPRSINTPNRPSWYPSHEAAWQVTGLQHYNQAELLGVTLALQCAVDIFRHAPPPQSSNWEQWDPPPVSESRSVTILTDSKAAMWDLTGDNWHTNSVRTDSEYWVIREANTAAMVAEAKGYARELRDMSVGVKISWVPGHMGVPGNEWVDGLSRFARLSRSRWDSEGSGRPRPLSWVRVDRRLVLDSDSER